MVGRISGQCETFKGRMQSRSFADVERYRYDKSVFRGSTGAEGGRFW